MTLLRAAAEWPFAAVRNAAAIGSCLARRAQSDAARLPGWCSRANARIGEPDHSRAGEASTVDGGAVAGVVGHGALADHEGPVAGQREQRLGDELIPDGVADGGSG